MQLPHVLAALVVAASATNLPAPAGASAPALSVVFHVKPPVSDDPALASADVALRAPEELGEPLHALRGHANARLAFAIAPAYLAALDRAAKGESALAAAAAGRATAGDARSTALLSILARHRPLEGLLSRSRTGARYLTLATAAQNELGGQRSTPFSARDLRDFTGVDAQVVLAASGLGATPGDIVASPTAVSALARADRAIADELDADVHAGAVELIATPDEEPVLPLLIDAGGQSRADPHVVSVGARADAQWLVSDAVRRVAAFARVSGVGAYSPFGAYDDATAAVMQSSAAAYALFSDRVVRSAGGQGSESGIDAARAAALRAYALTVAKGVVLPVIFWSEAESADLQTASGADGAMAQRLLDLASAASERARATSPSIFLLRVESQGPWSQRPDARTVMAKFIIALASGRAGRPVTPGAFLRAHAPTATAYGYPPTSAAGSFALWMGSADQASLWSALAAARKTAGGDAALARPQLRGLIVAAEAGDWFSSVTAPSSGTVIADRLDAFRALIASIYRAAGATPPAVIAPMKLPSPAPVTSTAPRPRPDP